MLESTRLGDAKPHRGAIDVPVDGERLRRPGCGCESPADVVACLANGMAIRVRGSPREYVEQAVHCVTGVTINVGYEAIPMSHIVHR